MRQVLIVLLTSTALFGCSSGGGSDGNPSGNSSPTISGNPSTATTIDQPYTFQASANDPDGDALTFKISNIPTWASFDTSSGRLTGQPALAHVGVYENIVISVSDGTASQSLSAFSISVNQQSSGNITLSWVSPTENADGSALEDLAGYKIYYGTSSRAYDNEIRIDNASVTTYVVEQLNQDTYYFATTAFNSSNVESGFSAEAVGTVF